MEEVIVLTPLIHFCNIMNNNETTVVPFEGVILDMDGTLIESTEADYLAWKRVFADYNIALPFEDYMPMLGMRSVDLVKQKLAHSKDAPETILQRKMDYFKEIAVQKGIKTVPFAMALLQNLKQYPVRIALATSSRREKMKLAMENVGMLSYFDVIVTGDEVHNGKPAPDIFILAAKRLQLPPHKCLVIEDAANGVMAAKSAHMKCIAITTTHEAGRLQQADLVIDSYENVDFKNWCALLNGAGVK